MLPIISPIVTASLVIVVVIFMLTERDDLRDRFIRLVGSDDLHRTTKLPEDAGSRVASQPTAIWPARCAISQKGPQTPQDHCRCFRMMRQGRWHWHEQSAMRHLTSYSARLRSRPAWPITCLTRPIRRMRTCWPKLKRLRARSPWTWSSAFCSNSTRNFCPSAFRWPPIGSTPAAMTFWYRRHD
jgi:hypothetical protein